MSRANDVEAGGRVNVEDLIARRGRGGGAILTGRWGATGVPSFNCFQLVQDTACTPERESTGKMRITSWEEERGGNLRNNVSMR